MAHILLGWRCRRRAFRRAGGTRYAEHISSGWRRWRRIFREWWRTTFRWAGGGDGAHFVKLAATAQISVRWRQWRRTFRQAGGRGASAHFVMQKFIGPGFAGIQHKHDPLRFCLRVCAALCFE